MTSEYVGIDLGGTKTIVACTDEKGKIIRQARENTPVALKDGINMLTRMVREVSPSPTSIGCACGGPLDYRNGVVSPLHMPQWRNVPLKETMEKEFNCPFRVDVDTNAAALGHPEMGHQSFAAALRHARDGFDLSRHRCECGAIGCLESFVSGNAIRIIYGKPAEEISGADIINEIAANLGEGLRNIIALHSPDAIFIGGGVAYGLGEKLLMPAIGAAKNNLKIVPVPAIRLASLGYDSALMGSIALAINGEN